MTDKNSTVEERSFDTCSRKGRPPKNAANKSKVHFNFANYLKEKHGRPIFGVQFSEVYKETDPPLFAAVGSNQVTIYECERNSGRIKLLSAYMDADSDENFFTCAWSYDGVTGLSLLAVAGSRGVIRVISPCSRQPAMNFIGHGLSINELRFSPKDHNILVSAGKDHTLRLWNISTQTCIAIFGGVEGHRDELLSADIDMSGRWLISCGMDHSFKVWRLDHPSVKEAIQRSYEHDPNDKKQKPFITYCHHLADFTTRDIHNNYVDCVRWWGKLVLSKSCDNNIVCWKPGKSSTFDDYFVKSSEGSNTTVLNRFEFNLCEIWYMRFALDFHGKLLAVGNQVGKIMVWDLEKEDARDSKCITLSHPKCTSPVRQVSFSKDGRILVGVCDDGTIWRWDLNANFTPSSPSPPSVSSFSSSASENNSPE